jgi:hypothetical protein
MAPAGQNCTYSSPAAVADETLSCDFSTSSPFTMNLDTSRSDLLVGWNRRSVNKPPSRALLGSTEAACRCCFLLRRTLSAASRPRAPWSTFISEVPSRRLGAVAELLQVVPERALRGFLKPSRSSSARISIRGTPRLSLADALELTLLIARKDRARRHPRVAARWLLRYLEEPATTIEEAGVVAASLSPLGSRPTMRPSGASGYDRPELSAHGPRTRAEAHALRPVRTRAPAPRSLGSLGRRDSEALAHRAHPQVGQRSPGRRAPDLARPP